MRLRPGIPLLQAGGCREGHGDGASFARIVMIAMARGWESKSVESQQTDDPLVREEPVDGQRHSLEMSRRRIVSELAATKSEARRASLEAALKHLDAELAKL